MTHCSHYFTTAMKLFVFISLLIVSLTGLAAEKKTYAGKVLYRYKNEVGTTVLDSKIPPQYVKKGYQVVNNYGQVMDTIAPEPTPEEIAARGAEAQQQADSLKRASEDAAQDKALLQMYSSAQDAERILANKTNALDIKIAYANSSIKQLQVKLDDEVTRAANTERRGREVRAATLEAIKSYRERILNSEETILKHQKEKEALKLDFAQIIERLEILKPKTSRLTTQ